MVAFAFAVGPKNTICEQLFLYAPVNQSLTTLTKLKKESLALTNPGYFMEGLSVGEAIVLPSGMGIHHPHTSL